MASNANPDGGPRATPWRLIGWGTAAAPLLVPWLAHAPWTLFDYVFAAVVFGIVGGAYELAVRSSANAAYRGGVAVALAASFLLVWINGAVGIIGDEGNPANLIYFGVIGTAFVGSIVARFQASGMARAMGVAAAAQLLVTLIALVGQFGAAEPPSPFGILGLNLFFALLWAASAILFRRAARN